MIGRSIVLVALAGLLLAGCGTNSAADSPTSTPTYGSNSQNPSSSVPSGMQQLVSCLSKHGVSMPGPGQGGQPPSSGGAPGSGLTAKQRKKMQAAFSACRGSMPQGGLAPGGASPGSGQAP